MNKPSEQIIIAENRRAKHNYQIEDTYECGIALLGSEVKSIRERHVSFADSYAIIKNHEVLLLGLKIERFKQATHEMLDPERTRKLLLNKSEIKRLEKLLQQKKLNLIPLKIYFKDSKVKILIGVGVSKSKVDKRDTIKDREAKIDIRRAVKRG